MSLLSWLRSRVRPEGSNSGSAVADDNLGPLSVVDEAVLDYLGEANPSVALLLSGNWGSGKTYFVSTRGARLAKRMGKRLVSLSVAGLQTREELSQALFFASAPLFANGTVAALGVFGRAGMRWLKIEPKDIKLDANLGEGQVAIVIDDIERFVGDQRIAFGFIVDLIDQHRVHVIMLAAEQLLLDLGAHAGAFGAWKEKIVGRTVVLAPDPPFIVATVLQAMGGISTAEKLYPHVEMIADLVEKWGMQNIRAAKHAIRELARLVRILGVDFDSLGGRQSILIAGVMIGLLEIRRDAGKRDLVSKFYNHADLSLVAILAEKDDGAESREQSFFRTLSARYEDTQLLLFPGAACFSDFFINGVIDKDQILAAFAGVPDMPTDRDLLLSEYFKLSDDRFNAELGVLVSDLKEMRLRSPREIVVAQSALSHFSGEGLVDLDQAEILRDSLAAIESLNDWELGDLYRDVDESFFDESRNPERRQLLEKLKERVAGARSRDHRSKQALFFSSLGNNSEALARELQSWRLQPLFIGDAPTIARSLSALAPSAIQEFIRLFRSRSRTSNVREFLEEEKGVLCEVADLIDRSENPPTLSSAQLQRLAKEMRALAEKL